MKIFALICYLLYILSFTSCQKELYGGRIPFKKLSAREKLLYKNCVLFLRNSLQNSHDSSSHLVVSDVVKGRGTVLQIIPPRFILFDNPPRRENDSLGYWASITNIEQLLAADSIADSYHNKPFRSRYLKKQNQQIKQTKHRQKYSSPSSVIYFCGIFHDNKVLADLRFLVADNHKFPEEAILGGGMALIFWFDNQASITDLDFFAYEE